MVTPRIVFVILSWLALSHSAFAEVVASVDRNPVMEHETFTLVLTSIDPQSRAAPELAPLNRDFEVIGRSQSSQTQIINGASTHKLEWRITLSPRRRGKLIIPSIKIGDEQTQPVSVDIIDAAQTPKGQQLKEIDLKVSVDNSSPYVQEQVIYTIRLYYRKPFENGSLTDPEAPDLLIRRVGEDRQFDELVNGTRYTVFERKYAIFPQKSGAIEIPGVVFDGVVSNGRSDFFARRGQRVRLRGDDHTVVVQAQPTDFSGQWWMPTSSLSIEEKWDQTPPEFKVGEPVTRTIVLQATGLTAQQLPELQPLNIPGIKSYPDQPEARDEATPQGVIAIQISKTALVPNQAGEFTLPAIEIPWWNTRTQRAEIARIPEKRITVAPAEIVENGNDGAMVSLPELELPDLPVATQAKTSSTSASQPHTSTWWPITSVIFGLLWLVTIVLWRRDKVRMSAAVPAATKGNEVTESHNERAARKALCAAVSGEEATLEDVYALCLAWGRALHPHAKIRNIVEFAEISRHDDALYGQLTNLDKARYATANSFDANELARAVTAHQMSFSKKPESTKATIADLYPA